LGLTQFLKKLGHSFFLNLERVWEAPTFHLRAFYLRPNLTGNPKFFLKGLLFQPLKLRFGRLIGPISFLLAWLSNLIYHLFRPSFLGNFPWEGKIRVISFKNQTKARNRGFSLVPLWSFWYRILI